MRQFNRLWERNDSVDIEIEISPGGEGIFERSRQVWHGEESDLPLIARFAGQEMLVMESDDEPAVFELEFLGLTGSGFKSVAEAKDAAPAFAKEVFQCLSQIIDEGG